MEIVFWLGRFYLDGRPSEFTDMGGCPALTAAEHLCSSGGTRDAVSSTAFHSGGVAIVDRVPNVGVRDRFLGRRKQEAVIA